MASEAKIAIAISTRGRDSVVKHSLSQWKKYYPEARVFIVEDNDEEPRGIAKTKNICIELLLNSEADHCFLVDDDIYPTDNIGLYRYVNSPHKHMSYSFEGISLSVFIKATINGHNIFNSPCGCLLYCTREVLLSGITYDTNYGTWGKEHEDFSVQIRKAGFTKYYFIDIVDSDKHFYSHDQHGTVESSVPESVRVKEIKRNTEFFNTKWGDL